MTQRGEGNYPANGGEPGNLIVYFDEKNHNLTVAFELYLESQRSFCDFSQLDVKKKSAHISILSTAIDRKGMFRVGCRAQIVFF